MNDKGKSDKPPLRRYFFDTEFNDGGDRFSCELISIGVISEDGREYYGISNEFNLAAAAAIPWIKKHVIDKLDDPSKWVSVEKIRQRILAMIEPAREVEFWSRNGSYDNVLLCQIFGGMGNLFETLRREKGVQKVTFRDIKELHRRAPEIRIRPKSEEGAHVAINDARHERYCFEVLSHAIAFKKNPPQPPSPN